MKISGESNQKVILLCGKLCSGKSTYAEKLRTEMGAAVLSVDEIMLTLFGQDAGEAHDCYVQNLMRLLLRKSVEFASVGISVILDTGLWTKAERKVVRAFYQNQGVVCEIHYLDVTDEEWKRRIAQRNKASVQNGSAYYVDAGLIEKANRIFEAPSREEIDVWVNQNILLDTPAQI